MDNDPFKKQLKSARAERSGDSLISQSTEEEPQTENKAAERSDSVQSEPSSSTKSHDMSQQTEIGNDNPHSTIAKFSAISMLLWFVGFILFEQISSIVAVGLMLASILVIGEYFRELDRKINV